MRPAHLALLEREARIGAVAVRADNAGESRTQHALQYLATAPPHQKQRGNDGDGDPQVALLMAFLPAGLIDIRHRLLLHRALDLSVDRCERAAGALVERWHAAQAERNVPQIREQQRHLAGTETIAPMQQRYQRHHLRAKAARGHLFWG
jgi:hypothetical protein